MAESAAWAKVQIDQGALQGALHITAHVYCYRKGGFADVDLECPFIQKVVM